MHEAINNLKPGDYIAFEWKHGTFGSEIIVDTITAVYDDKVLVHFLYGYKSEAEFVWKEDIIAIGDTNGDGKINGWSGRFNILIKDHELLKDEKKKNPHQLICYRAGWSDRRIAENNSKFWEWEMRYNGFKP